MATVDLSWTNTTTGGTTTGFKIWRWAGDLTAASGANDDAYVIANGTVVKDGSEALSTFSPSGENYSHADAGLAGSATYNYVLQASNTTGESPSATATDGDFGAVATVVVS